VNGGANGIGDGNSSGVDSNLPAPTTQQIPTLTGTLDPSRSPQVRIDPSSVANAKSTGFPSGAGAPSASLLTIPAGSLFTTGGRVTTESTQVVQTYSASTGPPTSGSQGSASSHTNIVAIVVPVVLSILALLGIVSFFLFRRRRRLLRAQQSLTFVPPTEFTGASIGGSRSAATMTQASMDTPVTVPTFARGAEDNGFLSDSFASLPRMSPLSPIPAFGRTPSPAARVPVPPVVPNSLRSRSPSPQGSASSSSSSSAYMSPDDASSNPFSDSHSTLRVPFTHSDPTVYTSAESMNGSNESVGGPRALLDPFVDPPALATQGADNRLSVASSGVDLPHSSESEYGFAV